MYSKQIIKSILMVLLISSALASCEYDTQIAHPANYVKIYMPQAVNNPVEFTYSDSTQVIIYGADYGGPNYPTKNIMVEFEVNNAYVDSFNIKNNTHYAPLPPKSYTLQQTSSVIHKGKVSTKPLSLTINRIQAIDTLKKYLLPICLVSADGYKINEELDVAYFVVRF